MRTLYLDKRVLTDDKPFIVAEIGANHCGDFELCCEMIREAARCGVDAVKLQKRDNSYLFTKTAYSEPYHSENSYAPTYGEHRDHLDWFGKYEFIQFQNTADKYGVILFATPFEEVSARFLHKMDMPFFKIASCDVRNIPFVKKVAEYGKALIISTGGASFDDIQRLTDAIDPINRNYAILHCVSTYPNEDKDLNLNVITKLRSRYYGKLIGLSSHHPGILPLTTAYMLGARIFEVHFTMNRGAKGTDHGFSMEPEGLRKLCQDIRRIPVMLGTNEKKVLPQEMGGFVVKMGKSIYPARKLEKGHRIENCDIVIRSPAGGMEPYEVEDVIGKELLVDCSTGECFRREWIK